MSLPPREQPEEHGPPDRAWRLLHPLDRFKFSPRPVSYPERERSRLAQQPSNPRELPGLIRPGDRSGFSQPFQQFHPAPTFPSESFRCPCQPPFATAPSGPIVKNGGPVYDCQSPSPSESPARAVRRGGVKQKVFVFPPGHRLSLCFLASFPGGLQRVSRGKIS